MNRAVKDKRVYVAGHSGLVGSALVRRLKADGFSNIVCASRGELDLLDEAGVSDFIRAKTPEIIIVAAARVGGIHANNTYRFEFIFENLRIQNNIIGAAHKNDVESCVFLGSSCIYPKLAPQPMPETCLLEGPLEPTNRPYALAKIAGLELIHSLRTQYQRNYFSVMPTNLYGIGDNFHPENSHVLPALLRRFHEAKENRDSNVTIWGTGSPLREFLFVDDCADAIVHLIKTVGGKTFAGRDYSHINLGSGTELSIADLAITIAEVVGYKGDVGFDSTRPDGTPRKMLDSTFLFELGWTARTKLKEGLAITYEWYKKEIEQGRVRV